MLCNATSLLRSLSRLSFLEKFEILEGREKRGLWHMICSITRLIVWPMSRLDLLFHQPSPMKMCEEVMACPELSDTVPTVL